MARPVPTDNRGTDTDEVAAAVRRAADALLSLQKPEGSWDGELHTSIIHDAEDVLLRQFLGIRTERETRATADWVRSQQRSDGTWSNAHDGPMELSITIAGYLALRLAGDDPEDAHLARARDQIRAGGGVAAASMFVRTWLALFGQWAWRDLPALPPQLIYAPRWFPLNIYTFASWVRTNLVPMMILGTLRPHRELGFDVRAELHYGQPRRLPLPARVIGSVRRLPFARGAIRRAAEWIVARQENDGSWYSSRPPIVWSLMALTAAGRPVTDPVCQAGLAALDGLTVHRQTPNGTVRKAVMFNGASWDTAGSIIALTDAGLDADDPRLGAARDYLLAQQVVATGDWSRARPTLATGGWPFFDGNQNYPDADDTALAVQALRRVHVPTARSEQVQAAVRAGTAWAVGMQCVEGGWAAFDADNTSSLADKLLTYTTATDRPCPEITGHVLEMLAGEDLADSPAARAGIDFLTRTQLPDGSWAGRWMVHHIYGTSAAVIGLVRTGTAPSADVVRRAVTWFEDHQNEDGGWGEDLRSLTDPDWVGRGVSTASQTAWGLMALVAAGCRERPAALRAIGWLLVNQLADGTWDEPQSTGVIGGGKVGYIPLRYDLSRLVWPLMALGRALA